MRWGCLGIIAASIASWIVVAVIGYALVHATVAWHDTLRFVALVLEEAAS